MTHNGRTYRLEDDGTLDTVISVDGTWTRWSQDYCALYGDGDGTFDLEAFVEDNEDELIEYREGFE